MKLLRILIVICCILGILAIFLLLGDKNTENIENTENTEDEWRKVNVYENNYFESTTIEIDLDGNAKKEIVEMEDEGKNIVIDGNRYVVNKYIDDDCDKNYFLLVDVNDDKKIEIIHRTCDDAISPPTNFYTIYNFKDNALHEIGSMNFIGSIPTYVYVKGNTMKFSYEPFGGAPGYMDEIVLELDV